MGRGCEFWLSMLSLLKYRVLIYSSSYQARRRRGGSGAIRQKLSHLYDLVLLDMQISEIYVGASGIAAKILFFELEVGYVIFTLGPKNVYYLTSRVLEINANFDCSQYERPGVTCEQINKVVFGTVKSARSSRFIIY